MAARSKIAQAAYDLAEPVASEMGLDLVDVEYKKEGSAYFLRIYADRKGGITIDECEKMSKVLDPIFDRELSADPDYFEVSSPGLTRPLKTRKDFLRCIGEEIDVRFFESREKGKVIKGIILDASEDSLVLDAGGTEETYLLSKIASAKRIIRF